MPIDALTARALVEPRAVDAARAGATGAPAPRGALANAARDFEALLLEQAFAAASRPIVEGVPLTGSSAERMYREMFVAEVAARAADSGGLGLADAIAPPEGAK
ncbi:MAG: rod-binding protein [Myxococcota bacterium]|nr:rod-binding protein [Myxococcales bacterium]